MKLTFKGKTAVVTGASGGIGLECVKKLQKEGFFKVMKMKSTYEKPSEKKKRIRTENLKRIKKQQKLRKRY